MFGKKKDEKEVAAVVQPAKPQAKPEFVPSSKTVIGEGAVFEGDFVTKNDLFIEGTVKGTVQSSKLLSVNKGGYFNGTANVMNLDVSGTVDGTVITENLSKINADGILNGSLKTHKFSIDPSSVFEGALSIAHKPAPVPEAAPAEEEPAAEVKPAE